MNILRFVVILGLLPAVVGAETRIQPLFSITGAKENLNGYIDHPHSLTTLDEPMMGARIQAAIPMPAGIYLTGSSFGRYGQEAGVDVIRMQNRIGLSAPYRPNPEITIRPFIDYQYDRQRLCLSGLCEDTSVDGMRYGTETRLWLFPGQFDVRYQIEYLSHGKDKSTETYGMGLWLTRAFRVGFNYRNNASAEQYNVTLEWH